MNILEREIFPLHQTSYEVGSDFVPFVENNISSTGLSAGAGKIKSSDERDIYGGNSKWFFDSFFFLFNSNIQIFLMNLFFFFCFFQTKIVVVISL